MIVIIADNLVLIIERWQKMLRIYKQIEIASLLRNGIEVIDTQKTRWHYQTIVDINMSRLTALQVLTKRKINNIFQDKRQRIGIPIFALKKIKKNEYSGKLDG